MDSCYSFSPTSDLKPPHPGNLTGKEASLVKKIPIFLNSLCSIIPWLRLTKPSWKHHLCASLQEAFGFTWSWSRRLRIHKSRAASLLFSLLLFVSTLTDQPGSLPVWLLAILVLLGCREHISWAGALLSHPSENFTSPCCFFIAVMTVIWIFGETLFSFLQPRVNPFLLAGYWSSIINHLYSGATY